MSDTTIDEHGNVAVSVPAGGARASGVAPKVSITMPLEWRIVPTLLHGDETSRTLAGRIASGLDRRVALLALNVDERGALLDVLEEAERPALAELRGVLADDLARRRGIE